MGIGVRNKHHFVRRVKAQAPNRQQLATHTFHLLFPSTSARSVHCSALKTLNPKQNHVIMQSNLGMKNRRVRGLK